MDYTKIVDSAASDLELEQQRDKVDCVKEDKADSCRGHELCRLSHIPMEEGLM